jgi:hypothetical protein
MRCATLYLIPSPNSGWKSGQGIRVFWLCVAELLLRLTPLVTAQFWAAQSARILPCSCNCDVACSHVSCLIRYGVFEDT